MIKTTFVVGVSAMVLFNSAVHSPFLNEIAVTPGANTIRFENRWIEAVCHQAWPYYDPICLRDVNRPGEPVRDVRVVSVDRMSAPSINRL